MNQVSTLGLKIIDPANYVVLSDNPDRLTCWRSPEFTVQTHRVPGEIVRLSVNRNQLIPGSRLYQGGISWDELQLIKDECGYAD
jgi:hypothetical protein